MTSRQAAETSQVPKIFRSDPGLTVKRTKEGQDDISSRHHLNREPGDTQGQGFRRKVQHTSSKTIFTPAAMMAATQISKTLD